METECPCGTGPKCPSSDACHSKPEGSILIATEAIGKIIIKGSHLSPEKILEIEQFLNGPKADELYQRFQVAMRIHL